jgi:hypothetical protein
MVPCTFAVIKRGEATMRTIFGTLRLCQQTLVVATGCRHSISMPAIGSGELQLAGVEKRCIF